MLKRTFSFWRRLVGQEPGPGGATGTEERRVWVRYPANVEATLQPAGGSDPGRFSASVRDISRGGANLVVNRAFHPGDLLSLELPVDERPSNVLACIVRVISLGEGAWALGCHFARELSDEDMEGLGGKREKHEPSDQRTWVRFPGSVRARYQYVKDSDQSAYPAQVLNISASGVGLLVRQAIETGTLLTVELAPGAQERPRTMLACVVHAAAQEPGEWALGCNFIHELDEDDLHALVGP
jgi:hypothetical protein